MSKWVKPPMPEATVRRRARMAAAQDGTCPECDLPLPEDFAETEIDHIIPRSRGGPDKPWNKRLVHFKCNRSKHTKLTGEAIALAAEYGLTLIEPLERRLAQLASREPEESEIPWWSWRKRLEHMDCVRYEPRLEGVIPSETACEECQARWAHLREAP